MAKLIGVDRSTLFRYEKGERTPDMDFLVKLALQFNLSLDDFIFSDCNPSIDNSNLNFKNKQNNLNFLKSKFLDNGFKLDFYINDFTNMEEVRILNKNTYEMLDNVEVSYFYKYNEPILDYIKRLEYYKNLNNHSPTLSDKDIINKYHALDEHSKSIIISTIEQFAKLSNSQSTSNNISKFENETYNPQI